nr:hypothetical protein [Bacillus atrophaeus]
MTDRSISLIKSIYSFLMEITLPDGEGYDICKQIRDNSLAPFALHQQQAELTKNGAAIELTPKELMLRTDFSQHQNQTFSSL